MNKTLICVLDFAVFWTPAHAALITPICLYSAKLLLLGRLSCVNQEVTLWIENSPFCKNHTDSIQLQSAIRTPRILAGTGIHICTLAFHRRNKERWKTKLGQRELAGHLDGD